MRIAKLYGHTIIPGMEVDITMIDDFKFKVVAILTNHFLVEWLVGDKAGEEGVVPYSIFSDDVVVEEIDEASDDPNMAFKMRKLQDG